MFTFQTVSSSKASFVTSGRSSLVIAFKALAAAKKGAFLRKSVANPNTFTDHAFLTRSCLLSCCRSRLDVAVFPYFSFASDKKVQKPSPWNWPRKVVGFLLLLFVANPVRTAKLKSSDRLQQQRHASSFPCQLSPQEENKMARHQSDSSVSHHSASGNVATLTCWIEPSWAILEDFFCHLWQILKGCCLPRSKSAAHWQAETIADLNIACLRDAANQQTFTSRSIKGISRNGPCENAHRALVGFLYSLLTSR